MSRFNISNDSMRQKKWTELTRVASSVVARTSFGIFVWLCGVALSVGAGAQSSGTPAALMTRCQDLTGRMIGGGYIAHASYVKDLRAFVAENGRALHMLLPPKAGVGAMSPAVSRSSVAFCRVEAVVTPAADAKIHIEVWLPAEGAWNGKFFGTGNGGAAGHIVYGALANGVIRRYAVASTDVGTSPPPGPDTFRYFIDHTQQRTNYVYRGIHDMTVVGKAVTAAYYGNNPKRSIFEGCSAGGYEAAGEAQRFPNDYNGIIIGDPGIDFGSLGLFQGYSYAVTHKDPQAEIPPSLLPVIAQAVMEQCDDIDGLKDGIIQDPRRCDFDPSRIKCTAGKTNDCLTAPQVAALRRIYAGYRDPRTGRLIYPGFPPGAELAGGAEARIVNNGSGSLINANTPAELIWVLGRNFKADDWLTFDFGTETPRLLAEMRHYDNSNPNLRAFRAHGGKLIVYEGWSDPNLFPMDILHYFERVEDATGGQKAASHWARLFMVPGMYHCGGGPGPNVFGQAEFVLNGVWVGSGPDDDITKAMDRWVTSGVAPERIVATKFQGNDLNHGVQMTRPLCAFPKVAGWNEKGSANSAANWVCANPNYKVASK